MDCATIDLNERSQDYSKHSSRFIPLRGLSPLYRTTIQSTTFDESIGDDAMDSGTDARQRTTREITPLLEQTLPIFLSTLGFL
ncbi:Hypothetical protein FKW44_014396, partial [Caligus rogercresseyi]